MPPFRHSQGLSDFLPSCQMDSDLPSPGSVGDTSRSRSCASRVHEFPHPSLDQRSSPVFANEGTDFGGSSMPLDDNLRESSSSSSQALVEEEVESDSAYTRPIDNSSIRHLPMEVLQRIMLDALGIPEDSHQAPPLGIDVCSYRAHGIIRKRSMSWVLSQVCHFWRAAALSFPKMWTSITMSF
jgi:hypothetical protein